MPHGWGGGGQRGEGRGVSVRRGKGNVDTGVHTDMCVLVCLCAMWALCVCVVCAHVCVWCVRMCVWCVSMCVCVRCVCVCVWTCQAVGGTPTGSVPGRSGSV